MSFSAQEVWPEPSDGGSGGVTNFTSDLNCTEFEFDSAVRIGFNSLWILIALLSVIGNGLIVDIYRRVRKARTSSNYCLILLAVSDMAFGAGIPVMVALYFVSKIYGMVGGYIQILYYCMFLFSVTASTLGLLAITYDRFLAIVWPLDYHTTMPIRRKVVMTMLVLPPSVILGFVIPLAWHNKYDPQDCNFDWDLLAALKLEYFRYLMFPLFILCNLLKITMYVVIFSKAIQFSRRKARNEQTTDQQTASKGEMRALRSGLMIFGSYYLCVLPFAVVIGIQVYNPDECLQDPTLITARSFCSLPLTMNSAFNPLIYCFRVDVFKKELKKMFCASNKGDRQKRSRYSSNFTGSEQFSVTSQGPTRP